MLFLYKQGARSANDQMLDFLCTEVYFIVKIGARRDLKWDFDNLHGKTTLFMWFTFSINA